MMIARIYCVLFIFSFIGLVSTQTPIIISNYSGELTSNSNTFSRIVGSRELYYYEAIEIRVNTTGTYTFNTSSNIQDTYGYIYQGNFYPDYPQYNIIVQDDDGAGNNQFKLVATLRSDLTYILVFTTYQPLITGWFEIVASGPDNVFNPTTTPAVLECGICELSSHTGTCINCNTDANCIVNCMCRNSNQQLVSTEFQLEINTGRRVILQNNNGRLETDGYCA